MFPKNLIAKLALLIIAVIWPNEINCIDANGNIDFAKVQQNAKQTPIIREERILDPAMQNAQDNSDDDVYKYLQSVNRQRGGGNCIGDAANTLWT